MKNKIIKTHRRKQNKDRYVYIELTNWVTYDTEELNNFVNKLYNDEGDINVNYNWTMYDYAMIFFVTTTREFIINNNLQEAFKHTYHNKISYYDKKYYPKYDLTKINTKDNGMYLD